MEDLEVQPLKASLPYYWRKDDTGWNLKHCTHSSHHFLKKTIPKDFESYLKAERWLKLNFYLR